MKEALSALLAPDRVHTRPIDRLAHATDASLYRLVPKAVVRPETVEEVRRLFRFSRERRIPLCFRAAGTSLSGQALTDGILVDLSRHWKGLKVEDGGKRVRFEPGVIGAFVNAALHPFGARIGPDPASIHACMMGGILANNASGMCCGVSQNAYHTLESLTCVLPDGTVIDTAKDRLPPALAEGLLSIRSRIGPDLKERIRAKYRIKNTLGYALNAFLDYERPEDILAHLLIGSEGTLGFIAEAVLRTVPDPREKATGLLFYGSVREAAEAVDPLAASGAAAVEIMDRKALASVGKDAEAALLVEYQGEQARHRPEPFTTDPAARAALWQIRKGMAPSVGAMRARGTMVIHEDVAFPPGRLAEGIERLQALFAAHGYAEAILFGHAKDANLHFVLTPRLPDPAEVTRYGAFMDGLAGLVTSMGGSLKAEHGTGRNMAPFVETEWGAEAVGVMRALKRLLDPEHLLNPGVILNDDPKAHLKDLKAMPEVEAEVDRCIECGFCEPKCPSRDLTLTPRQRIVLRREIAVAEPGLKKELLKDYAYDGEETCAADGLCATACPVGIDTGALVKRLRTERHGASKAVAGFVSRHLGWLEMFGPSLPRTNRVGAAFAYFPSCVTRTMGERALPEALVELGKRAGLSVWIPEARGLCCGMPFSSKGYPEAAKESRGRLGAKIREWGLPVVTDTSPCAYSMKAEGVKVLDPIEFAHDVLLPRLKLKPMEEKAVLHPVCSAVKMGLEGKMKAVAEACASEAVVPPSAGCCAFAGDKGWWTPELTASATKWEAGEVRTLGGTGFYASSRTCEMGMGRATGEDYHSILLLLERASREGYPDPD